MNTTTELSNSINWFEIVTDIVIPSLSIISTLIIGIIITIALKNREEKSKIKQLLIDHYMDYLVARNVDIISQINFVTYEVVNEILISPKLFFKINPIPKSTLEIIERKTIDLKKKADNVDDKYSHWTLYTHRFSFLLGKENYNKVAYDFEKNIEHNILGKNCIDDFIANTVKKMESHEVIIQNLNSSNDFDVEMGIYHIQRFVQDEYVEYQKKYFEPYNQSIADLIYKQ